MGFLESSLERFVAAHRDQVERGSRFRQLSDGERDEIVRRARRMAIYRSGQVGLVEVARRIARKMERSTETIRLTLKAYDREHPDRAIFAPSAPALDEDAKGQIYLKYRMGVSVDVLAAQFGRTRSSIYRLINEVRARRILETKLEFIPHASFDDPAEEARSWRRCPLRPVARPRGGRRPPRDCRPTWPAFMKCPCSTASRNCTCSAR